MHIGLAGYTVCNYYMRTIFEVRKGVLVFLRMVCRVFVLARLPSLQYCYIVFNFWSVSRNYIK